MGVSEHMAQSRAAAPRVRVGLSAYGMAAPDLVSLAVAADGAGFHSLWLGEHVALPVGYSSDHPTQAGSARQAEVKPIVDPATRLVDPLVALGACAVVTTSIHLATGIYLLPLRPPLIAARMAHTVHELSGGRLAMGLGAGWLVEEFAAVGVPFESRVSRLEEGIEVLRGAWAGGPFDHHGRFFSFESIQVTESPAAIPIILGGNSPPALRRAARLGDGWFSSGTPTPDDACRYRDRLVVERSSAGRREPFEIAVRMAGCAPESLAGYAAEGFDHVVIWADQVWPPHLDLEARQAYLADMALTLGLLPVQKDQAHD